MDLYFITGNKNKFEEIKFLIPDIQQLDIDLPEIQEIDAHVIIRKKLDEACKHHTGTFIVEDTSLYLACLNDFPGPLIKWFLKSMKNEGIASLTSKLQNTNAIARTIIGYATNQNDIQFFEGEIQGNIVTPRGENGFGWDSIFQPAGQEKTFAEMTSEEKNNQDMNMRRIAVNKLKDFLEESIF